MRVVAAKTGCRVRTRHDGRGDPVAAAHVGDASPPAEQVLDSQGGEPTGREMSHIGVSKEARAAAEEPPVVVRPNRLRDPYGTPSGAYPGRPTRRRQLQTPGAGKPGSPRWPTRQQPLASARTAAGQGQTRDSPRLVAGEAIRAHSTANGIETALTPLQYALLRHLTGAPDRVVSRDELVQSVWQRPFVGSNVVDAAVCSLRKKLGEHADAIETVKGFGYRFRVK